MEPFERQRGEYVLSSDKAKLDIGTIHRYLAGSSYWAKGRSLQTMAIGIEHSLCFGLYAASGAQVGFARVVTDQATFAWICDVFVLEPHRGKGLGKWLVQTIVGQLELMNPKRMVLATQDAHGLYSKYGGFEPLRNPERWMERLRNPLDSGQSAERFPDEQT
ncbi:MAG: GNAT family N-acetyltransferase [Anaerolineales bacterium]|jgi:GNAT superfamily N-acetyltransferase